MRLHHAAVAARTEENADAFFQGILGLSKIKASTLNSDLAFNIFGIQADCRLLLYGNEDLTVEVIVSDPLPEQHKTFTHLCLQVEDREAFMERCRSAGLVTRLVPKGETLLCFIMDLDGNLYEIKE